MFAKLRKIAKRLQAAKETDAYWPIQAEFKAALLATLDDHAAVAAFTKRQLLQFLAWCSSHRPCEPHSLLTTLSRINDEL